MKAKVLSLVICLFILCTAVSAEAVSSQEIVTEEKTVTVNGSEYEIRTFSSYGEDYVSIAELARIHGYEKTENASALWLDDNVLSAIEEEASAVIEELSAEHPLFKSVISYSVNALCERLTENAVTEEADLGRSEIIEDYFEGYYSAYLSENWEICADGGGMYIESNDRVFLCPSEIIDLDGEPFAPIETVMRALGYCFGENDEIVGGELQSGDEYYGEDEVYWLSKIIQAESGAEPLTGKLAVGNVVLNRCRSKDFPNTVYSVIWDRQFGVQFSPTENGAIMNPPSAQSLAAAKICLEGDTVSNEILFFVNPDIAESDWVEVNREYEMTIGNHEFYS